MWLYIVSEINTKIEIFFHNHRKFKKTKTKMLFIYHKYIYIDCFHKMIKETVVTHLIQIVFFKKCLLLFLEQFICIILMLASEIHSYFSN